MFEFVKNFKKEKEVRTKGLAWIPTCGGYQAAQISRIQDPHDITKYTDEIIEVFGEITETEYFKLKIGDRLEKELRSFSGKAQALLKRSLESYTGFRGSIQMYTI